MRLASLNPRVTWSPGQSYTHQLDFDCPACGPPFRVLVCCRLGGPPSPGVWQLTLPERPSGDGWDGVTVQPSIANHNHGRKKQCTFHCSIINGEVLP